MSAIAGIGEGLGGVLDVDLEAVPLEHLGDDMGALLGLVAAPAAPDDQRFAHFVFLHSILRQSSCADARRGGIGAGRSGRLAIATAVPASDEVWNASITSST